MSKIAATAFAVLLAVVPPSANSAPTPVRAKRFGPVVFSGTLTVAIEDDFAQGRATKRYSLHESNLEQHYELRLHGNEREHLTTGMKVRVKGTLSGNVLTADLTADAVTVLESTTVAAPTTARRVVVILIDIVDGTGLKHSISSACDGSTAQAAGIMFGQNGRATHVDGCYQDSSFGVMGWGGAAYPGSSLDVVRVTVDDGTLTLGTTCNYSAWGTAADSAATILGVNLSNYQHRLYVVPADVGCSWAGLAYIGCGNSCRAWLKAYSTQPCGYSDAYAHELGHNVGFYHASTDTNNDGTIDCEYCDDSDFMGYAEGILRTQNGPHKAQLGWVGGSSGIVDATAGGQFTISALEQPAAPLPQLVKIMPGSGKPYYLSYRVQMGYDAAIPQPTKYANRTNIHRWDSGNSRYIASIGDGQSFVDAVNGITVTQNAHDAGSATITISTTPTPQAPSVSVSPAQQGTNVLPATMSYLVNVTNNDSVGSPSSVFALDVDIAPGWTGGIVPASLTLAPGLSGTATLSVTAPAGTTDGNYGVGARTVADATHAGTSALGTYAIDTTKPTSPSGLTATSGKRSRVTLNWTAATDTGGSGVASYRLYRNGTQLPGTITTTTFVDTPGNGTWTYTVRALDVAGNLSNASNSAGITVGRR